MNILLDTMFRQGYQIKSDISVYLGKARFTMMKI